MAISPSEANSGTPPILEEAGSPHVDAPELRAFVMALFFIFGGITSLNDVIIPKLKELFTLNYTQAMLVQTAFFAAYAIVSIPGAALVKHIGYMRGAVFGLVTMMVGCLLFIPASASATFGVFLFALFVLAAGVTIVQVVANPLISLLGPVKTTHSRLTFAQAFNSLGTTLFPYFGTIVMLGGLATVSASELSGPALDAYRIAETAAVERAYLGLAAALAVIAGVVWLNRDRLKGERHESGSIIKNFDLLRRKRFGFGAVSIFLYVGAEVAIGSLIVNYLMQDHVLGLAERDAGKLIPLYWGGALVGRFIGSAVLRAVSPGKVLAFNAVCAIALILVSTLGTGAVSGYSYLAIGLMNSIMFPTIFSLASEGLGDRHADGSGVICVMIVGGAIIPPLTGQLADLSGSLAIALALPALCYATIATFGWYARKPVDTYIPKD
ncbi:sugar MFS transporter [Novosphingobium malaysiense]|uniref:Glucose transporter n=1 Tax=Novosphingobium malaysiense TaxID=1348853 RepID=A0A0B1ZKZ2_9SPHN|nr:sugar MFS transporter [Novosphingobium malaysiense]KHK89848.1 glucose transporter [Novosphingobium malaysiense]